MCVLLEPASSALPGHRVCSNTWKASPFAHNEFVAEHAVLSKGYPRGSRNQVLGLSEIIK